MKTLNQLFEDSVIQYTENVLLLEKQTGKYEPFTYRQIRKEAHLFAAGLLSLGIQKGDRIALFSEGRKDWVISELGILYTGAVNVPLSVRLAEPSELKFRLMHSGTRMIITSGNQAKKLEPLINKLKDLEKIILLDPKETYNEKELFYGDICKKGEQFLEKNNELFEERWLSVKPDDYANICYTSGTTADPKGIILTHRNYYVNIQQARSLMPVPEWYTTLLILPWDHAFAHTCGIYTVISAGASLASVQLGKTPMETLKNIPVNIKEIKPVFLLSVPALAKNFRKNIEKGVREKGPVIEKLFNHALKIAYRYNGIGWDRGKGNRALLKPFLWLYDKILFQKIRESFGGRLRFFIGGGALLDIELQKFFYALGIPMFQGYGLTEAAPVISSNSEERHKLGSSGYLVTNLELKICDENGNELPEGKQGEIVVKGENVMAGYWKNEEATNNTIKNGWLHTGDLGYMDRDGFLYVLGRFKSLLIADDGEKYSPEGIEEAMMQHCNFIDQCMMYNNQKPYSVMLVVLTRDTIKQWLSQNNLSPDKEEGWRAALKELEDQLSIYRTGGQYQDMFPQRWLPAAVGILPEPFTEDNRMVNSTMKIVRSKITETYQDIIDYLYTPSAKNIQNEKNINAVKKLFESG
jgi:long-chain acyl-CoA synthetase